MKVPYIIYEYIWILSDIHGSRRVWRKASDI